MNSGCKVNDVILAIVTNQSMSLKVRLAVHNGVIANAYLSFCMNVNVGYDKRGMKVELMLWKCVPYKACVV